MLFSVYPNPVNGVMTIEGIKGSQSIKLVNAFGQVTKEIILRNEDKLQVDIHSLEKVIYLMHLKTGNTIYNKKVVVF